MSGNAGINISPFVWGLTTVYALHGLQAAAAECKEEEVLSCNMSVIKLAVGRVRVRSTSRTVLQGPRNRVVPHHKAYSLGTTYPSTSNLTHCW